MTDHKDDIREDFPQAASLTITPLGAPFRALVEFMEENDELIEVTVMSIASMEGVGRLAKTLVEAGITLAKSGERPFTDKENRRIADAERHEMMAHKVQESGYPILYSHAAVAIWGALEATVPLFVARAIVANPDRLNSGHFEKLRIPVSAFTTGNQEDVAAAILDEYLSKLPLSQKAGAMRFLSMLEAIDLPLVVSEEIKRDLRELAEIRHLVVHRMSIVDADFVRRCPWKQVAVGDRLKVSREDYGRFRRAVGHFAADVLESCVSKIEPENFIKAAISDSTSSDRHIADPTTVGAK